MFDGSFRLIQSCDWHMHSIVGKSTSRSIQWTHHCHSSVTNGVISGEPGVDKSFIEIKQDKTGIMLIPSEDNNIQHTCLLWQVNIGHAGVWQIIPPIIFTYTSQHSRTRHNNESCGLLLFIIVFIQAYGQLDVDLQSTSSYAYWYSWQNGMTRYSKWPYLVRKAVFHSSPSAILTRL